MHQYTYTTPKTDSRVKVTAFILTASLLVTAAVTSALKWNWSIIDVTWAVATASLMPLAFSLLQGIYHHFLWPQPKIRTLLGHLGADIAPDLTGEYPVSYGYNIAGSGNAPESSGGRMKITQDAERMTISVEFRANEQDQHLIGRSTSHMSTITVLDSAEHVKIVYTYRYESWRDWQTQSDMVAINGTGELRMKYVRAAMKWELVDGRYYNEKGELGSIRGEAQ